MRVVFTVSKYPLSKLICWITGEPVSHCALVADDTVAQSNLLGVGIEPLSDFLSSSTILYQVDVPDNYPHLLNLIATYRHAWYDWGAFLYIGLSRLIPMLPKKDNWAITGTFICTEWVTEVLDGKPDSQITPYQLYLLLSKQPQGEQ